MSLDRNSDCVREGQDPQMRESRIPLERCAQRILQREIGRLVVFHDTGHKPGMFDLRVGDVDTPEIAIECVGAVNRARVETWNIGPARGSFSLALTGDWYVVITPETRWKEARARLQDALHMCEASGVRRFTVVDWALKHQHPRIFDALEGLRIHAIACFREPGSGKVYTTMTGTGGAVDDYGTAVPGWITEFLHDPCQKDVITKLERSGARQRHVFVGVDFMGVPWPVESYLGTRTDHLPEMPPSLPPPVDAVWILYDRRGVQWGGSKWRFFDA